MVMKRWKSRLWLRFGLCKGSMIGSCSKARMFALGEARICVLYTHFFCGELRAMEIIVVFFSHADLFPRHASNRDDLLSSNCELPRRIVSNVTLRPLFELDQEPCLCCSPFSICPVLSSPCLSNKTMGHAFAPPRSFYLRLIRVFDSLISCRAGPLGFNERQSKAVRGTSEGEGYRASGYGSQRLHAYTQGSVFVSALSCALINVLSGALVVLRL